MTATRPPRLKKGDTVRVISLSGTFPKDSWETARAFTDPLGLKLEIGKSMYVDPGYIGRDPRRRADDFNSAVRSDKVRGIFLFRGGNTAAETLPYLDLTALKKHPKVIAGFSDHSSIVAAAHTIGNLVTFLVPPMSTPGKRNMTIDYFRRMALDGESGVEMPAMKNETWRGGSAKGRIVGCNLAVLREIVGTPFFPATKGAILAWEEVSEELQDINMVLTQLRNAGVMAGLAGMLVGHLEGIKAKEDGIPLKSFVLDKFARGPVLKTRAFGHFRPCFPLPVGVRAELDASRKTFALAERAVD
jgi:muramoyltetrapeptide carboxypeptidase